jgi:hypothetical protein
MTQGWSRHRLVAFIVVAALHFLFLLLLWIREPVTRRVAHSDEASVLFFIDAPRPSTTTAPPVQVSSAQPAATVIAEPSSPKETFTAPEPTNSSPTIDWAAQATEAAAAVVDKTIRDETRKCDPEDRPKSFLPPCHPKVKPFEWNPNAARVGFSNGLPFVRVGERCVIGLGFFGCGFGDPPPANGDLFEAMDDPERERSSVPSSDP